jgi:CBS-domain-containing membrane protein
MDAECPVISLDASVSDATRFFNRENLHVAFVVDGDNHLEGVLNWWTVARKTEGSIAEYVQPCASARRDTRLEDLVPIALKADHPVAIVCEENRIQGAVRRLDLLQTLARDLEEDRPEEPSTNGFGHVEAEMAELADPLARKTATGD